MIYLIIFLLNSILFAEQKYKEPQFKLLERIDNIEIRQYDETIVAKISISIDQDKSDNNMFRTLASYIFGNNQENKNIPMTAPVTTFKNNDSYEMLFYMLDSNSIDDLPDPINNNISFEKFNLDKCAVISFSWFVYDKKILKYQRKLKNYLDKNSLVQDSPFMLNRYDPPWRLPFLRRNEILVKIK